MEKQQRPLGKAALVWRFLKGSKLFFLLSVFAAMLTVLADMLTPQIIRAAVDNAIGGNAPTFGPAVMKLVDAVGGFDYLGKNLWIMALAVLAVAMLKVVSHYLYLIFNTKASETLVKTMRDTLYTHIEASCILRRTPLIRPATTIPNSTTISSGPSVSRTTAPRHSVRIADSSFVTF